MTGLTGSEKQVAWATEIRTRLVGDLRSVMEKIEKTTVAGSDDVVESIRIAATSIEGQSTASWWIDHKDTRRALSLLRSTFLDVTAPVEDEDARDAAMDRFDSFTDAIGMS